MYFIYCCNCCIVVIVIAGEGGYPVVSQETTKMFSHVLIWFFVWGMVVMVGWVLRGGIGGRDKIFSFRNANTTKVGFI